MGQGAWFTVAVVIIPDLLRFTVAMVIIPGRAVVYLTGAPIAQPGGGTAARNPHLRAA